MFSCNFWSFCGLVYFLPVVMCDIFSNNNMCLNDADYDRLDQSENCYYNPDLDSTTPELIETNGYPLEIHQTTTEDGYILTVFRIPHDNKNISTPRQPIFLMHGIIENSAVWVDKRKRSLAFFLVENGYDVWLGSYRGSIYSQGHVNLTSHPRNREYWDFSLYQVGIGDISAELGLIANITGRKRKIIYMGHSMGTTVAFIYASTKRKESEKYLSGIVALAPVLYVHNSPAVASIRRLSPFLKRSFSTLGVAGLFTTRAANNIILEYIKRGGRNALQNIRNILAGFGEAFNPKMSSEELTLFFNTEPDGVSLNVLYNYLDMFDKKVPIGFDYGTEKNLKIYGARKPIKYDVSNIRLPVHIFYGPNDKIADVKDVYLLYNDLNTEKTITSLAEDQRVNFSHLSFVYGEKIVEQFYLPLLRTLKTFN